MKLNCFSAFTLGVLITAVSAGAVTFASATGDVTIKACADKRTGAMRHITRGNCKRTEKLLSWNQSGIPGVQGAAGTQGLTGSAGPSGANGMVGPRGETGALDGSGSSGPAFMTGFTAQNTCGPEGTSLCAIGAQGPGGGTVFFIDTAGKYGDLDYLEAAPTNAATAVWATPTPHCGLAMVSDCASEFVTSKGESLKFLAIGSGRSATATLIAKHNVGGISKADYAAGVADLYVTPTASDWWLPSLEELNELCKYAQNTGQPPGPTTSCSGGSIRNGFLEGAYWSSS